MARQRVAGDLTGPPPPPAAPCLLLPRLLYPPRVRRSGASMAAWWGVGAPALGRRRPFLLQGPSLLSAPSQRRLLPTLLRLGSGRLSPDPALPLARAVALGGASPWPAAGDSAGALPLSLRARPGGWPRPKQRRTARRQFSRRLPSFPLPPPSFSLSPALRLTSGGMMARGWLGLPPRASLRPPLVLRPGSGRPELSHRLFRTPSPPLRLPPFRLLFVAVRMRLCFGAFGLGSGREMESVLLLALSSLLCSYLGCCSRLGKNGEMGLGLAVGEIKMALL